MCLGVMVCDLLVKPVKADFLKKDTNRVDFIKLSSGGDAFEEFNRHADRGCIRLHQDHIPVKKMNLL